MNNRLVGEISFILQLSSTVHLDIIKRKDTSKNFLPQWKRSSLLAGIEIPNIQRGVQEL